MHVTLLARDPGAPEPSGLGIVVTVGVTHFESMSVGGVGETATTTNPLPPGTCFNVTMHHINDYTFDPLTGQLTVYRFQYRISW